MEAMAVDVSHLIHGLIDLIGSTLGPAIELKIEKASDLPPAKADPNQLELALLYLAVNARDAMPHGGTLTIAVTRESVREPRAGLTRGHYGRDTGTGIDEETRAGAAEPFFSTKGIGKGTGLSLSMVHGLAAQLGGALTIDSEIGKGTAVTLWLRICHDLPEAEHRPTPSIEHRDGLGIALLVDDEDVVRMSTAHMLSELAMRWWRPHPVKRRSG